MAPVFSWSEPFKGRHVSGYTEYGNQQGNECKHARLHHQRADSSSSQEWQGSKSQNKNHIVRNSLLEVPMQEGIKRPLTAAARTEESGLLLKRTARHPHGQGRIK